MNIAILSRNANLYSTRRLLEAAQAAGHNADVLDHYKCYVVLEKSKPTLHYNNEPLKEYDAVIPRIGASATFYGAAIVRQFEMMRVFTANSSMAITRSRDKLRSMQIMAAEGINMPTTGFAHTPADNDDLFNKIGGPPIILKLLEGTQGAGVVLAETRKAAQSVLDAFHNLDTNLLIQEFISESAGADVRAFVVNGKVVAAMRRQGKEGEFRSNLHRGGAAENLSLTREEKSLALKAAKAMGLRIAGVDLLQSARGPLVIEVNSSPGLEGIEKTTGVNVAGSIIAFIEEHAAKQPKRKPNVGH